ncbi:hypothetical protein L6Q21_00175 [Sandaracinobacter sp. RS1-74]|uniref:hypothetical protein n=1 Tax=Sandaracinobacteroides sayramensis TaxID=2913411 RepID=UPI001EDC3C93|nr:hypothetical protein [Sandaracinobacteroides sayramensis]MCG2839392.1 hypothetical protein [Sandaracinobacteroides sayramensis]
MISKAFLAMAAIALAAAPLAAQAKSAPASVPVSAHDLGSFPFVKAPAGFVARNGKKLGFEEKYIFAGGQPLIVSGPYYHADIFANGGEWNETLLLSQLDRQITGLGGVRVFDGAIPDSGRKLIEENAPRFVQDLYDPWPYRFRQYLIRQEDKLVWIELGYRYNAEMIDLTVVQEDPKK